jgi:hypothetical protein
MLCVSPSLRTKDVIARTRRAIAELQLTLIAIAHSMMDHAERSLDRQAAERCRRRAHTAYVAVVHRLPKLHLTPEEAARLKEQLAALKGRLEAVQVTRFN